MIEAFDFAGDRHFCQDELATTVSGRWICQCPGGPFYSSRQAAATAWNEQTRAWEEQREREIEDGFTTPAAKRLEQEEQRRGLLFHVKHSAQ